MRELFLGIDVGSVSTNLAVVDRDNQVISSQYLKNNGQPVESIRYAFNKLIDEIQSDGKILGVGATGSGRQLIGLMVGADVIKNEITAHAKAVTTLIPEAQTIFEIGGQDSKVILLKNGRVTDFAMNTVCAAGTGSFLEHQSERLGIPIQEFGELALKAEKKVRIAGRCTVFAESDMISKQQYGFSKEEIINGLCEAMVRNYLNNLCRGKKLEPPYVFQGGVAANKGIKKAFETELGEEIIIPQHYGVMGAIGSAVIAKDYISKTGKTTVFKGLDLVRHAFTPSSFDCEGCDNVCEVIKVEMDKRVIGMWGDRCGKWSQSVAAT